MKLPRRLSLAIALLLLAFVLIPKPTPHTAAASHPPTSSTFVDVPASYFAYIYIETAYALGIIRGVDATHFAPSSPIRRDEMAQIVYKGVTTT